MGVVNGECRPTHVSYFFYVVLQIKYIISYLLFAQGTGVLLKKHKSFVSRLWGRRTF